MAVNFRRVCIEMKKDGKIIFGSYDFGEKVYNLFENKILPKLQEKYADIKYYDYVYTREI